MLVHRYWSAMSTSTALVVAFLSSTATTANGQSPSAPVGSIVAYAGTPASLPANWRVCDGSELSRRDFDVLFNRLSTAWGPGNGTTTFNLPDLRGRFVRGVDGGTGRDKGPRMPIRRGALEPTEVGTLELDALQSHIHTAAQSAADGGHSHPVNVERVNIAGSNRTRDVEEGGDKFNSDPGLGSISASIPANTGAHTHSVVISPPTAAPGQPGAVRTSAETRPENAAVFWICKVQ